MAHSTFSPVIALVSTKATPLDLQYFMASEVGTSWIAGRIYNTLIVEIRFVADYNDLDVAFAELTRIFDPHIERREALLAGHQDRAYLVMS